MGFSFASQRRRLRFGLAIRSPRRWRNSGLAEDRKQCSLFDWLVAMMWDGDGSAFIISPFEMATFRLHKPEAMFAQNRLYLSVRKRLHS